MIPSNGGDEVTSEAEATLIRQKVLLQLQTETSEGSSCRVLLQKEFLSTRSCQNTGQIHVVWAVRTVTRPDIFRLAVQPPLFFVFLFQTPPQGAFLSAILTGFDVGA